MADTPEKPDERAPKRKRSAPAADKKAPARRKRKPGEPKKTPSGLPEAEAQERLKEIIRVRLSYPTWSWPQVAAHVSAIKPTWAITRQSAMVGYYKWLEEKNDELATMRGGVSGVVQEHLQGLRVMREMATTIASEASMGFYRIRETDGEVTTRAIAANHSVALGAIARAAELRITEIVFLQDMGLLPRHLGVVRMEIDAKRMMKGFEEVLQKHLTGRKRLMAQADLVEALRPAVTAGVLEVMGRHEEE